MKHLKKGSSGFTLIELLIVVAIIAILAAIAVPNFLEAQTRSKVSRAQADMRSMATALEAYMVDNNRYPYGRSIWIGDYGGLSTVTDGSTGWNPEPSFRCLMLLTTPISYITSLPPDPFAEGGGAKHYVPVQADMGQPYYTFYYDDYQPYGDDRLDLDPNTPGFMSNDVWRLNAFGYRWSMHSVGPLRWHGSMRRALLGNDNPIGDHPEPGHTITEFNSPYDPTNGTLSTGAIARTNKGVFKEVNKGKVPNMSM